MRPSKAQNRLPWDILPSTSWLTLVVYTIPALQRKSPWSHSYRYVVGNRARGSRTNVLWRTYYIPYTVPNIFFILTVFLHRFRGLHHWFHQITEAYTQLAWCLPRAPTNGVNISVCSLRYLYQNQLECPLNIQIHDTPLAAPKSTTTATTKLKVWISRLKLWNPRD